jgi:hypothetical protein
MEEFKKAHRKMFKNGYVENEYQQLADEPSLSTELEQHSGSNAMVSVYRNIT